MIGYHKLLKKAKEYIGDFPEDKCLVADLEFLDTWQEINRWLKALENYHKKTHIPVPFDEWVEYWSEDE